MAEKKTKTKTKRKKKDEPVTDDDATLAEDAAEKAQDGDYETEGEGAESEETSKGDFLSEQRRREDLAIDVGRDFPDKYRLSGSMEGCPDEAKLALYERLVKLRRFDARMRKLFRQGRFEGTYYSQIGQEACDAVLTFQMKKTDFVGPSHRDLGASVGKGVPLKFLAAQVYNRVDSPDAGRYTACHYWHPDYAVMQPSTSIMMNWIAATGAAFGFRMLGRDEVAAAFGGDGATAHGDFHEGCNFAAVHKLPIVYVIQNNLWAESLPLHLTTALENLSERAKAFGFPGVTVDGNDVVAVWNATRTALDRARSGEGPTLIEMKTYRWFGHSDIDPADYRSDDEVEAWMERDPLPRFTAWLEDEGVLDEETKEGVFERVESDIEAAVEFAEASERPDADSFLSEVYAHDYPGFDVRAGR